MDFSDLLLLLNWTWEINCELISECSILKWKLVLNFKNSNSWSNSYSTSFWFMIICALNLDHKLFVVRKVICFFIPVLLVERLSSQLHSKQCCHYIYFSISRFICKKISFCVFFARDDKEIEKCIFCVFYFFIMEKVKMLFRREKSYVYEEESVWTVCQCEKCFLKFRSDNFDVKDASRFWKTNKISKPTNNDSRNPHEIKLVELNRSWSRETTLCFIIVKIILVI